MIRFVHFIFPGERAYLGTDTQQKELRKLSYSGKHIFFQYLYIIPEQCNMYEHLKSVRLCAFYTFWFFYILIIKAQRGLSSEGPKFKFIKLGSLFIWAEKNHHTEK